MFKIDFKIVRTVEPFNYSWDKNLSGDIINLIKWLYNGNGGIYEIKKKISQELLPN